MQDFLITAGAVAAALTAIVGIIGTVLAVVKKPWKTWRAKLSQVDAALVQLAKIDAALGPNGGKSLADAIGRIEKTTAKVMAKQNAFADFIERPMFETCDEGEWERINRAFEMVFGVAATDAIGNEWINLIDPSDRDRVVREWKFAVHDARRFRSECWMLTRAGKRHRVVITAQPTPAVNTGKPYGWFGQIDIVKVATA